MKFLLFIIAVIAIGAGTIKLKQKNRQVMKNTLKEVWDSIPEESPAASVAPVKTEPKTPAPAPAWPKTVALKDVVIPETSPIKEEIENIIYMAETYPEEMNVFFYEPTNTTSIAMFEARTGIRLPDDLKALYLLTNGLDIEHATLLFYPLEVVEQDYNLGYCDFVKEGDAGDYLLLGDVIGDGECVIMHKESGHISRYFEGNMGNFKSVKEVLFWIIEWIYEGWIGNGTDARLDEYLSKFSTT
ncbi:MAG: SMI1/KNR4 family protein [Lachnospiraceae bacterium]|nr:SMI1/KNR4 family protein [Lachnospiraceae bacterium]MBR6849885.1 SMI1/KNR4 family protein [Lachnospiraceae bacterium]